MHLVQEIRCFYYSDVIMGAIACQITSLMIAYSTAYSVADHRTHQSSASLAIVRGNHRWPVNSPHKWPLTRKMFPFDDVIMPQLQVGNLVVQSPLTTWSNIRRYCIRRNDVRDKTKVMNSYWLQYNGRWWHIYISSSESTNSIYQIQQTMIFTVAFFYIKRRVKPALCSAGLSYYINTKSWNTVTHPYHIINSIQFT